MFMFKIAITSLLASIALIGTTETQTNTLVTTPTSGTTVISATPPSSTILPTTTEEPDLKTTTETSATLPLNTTVPVTIGPETIVQPSTETITVPTGTQNSGVTTVTPTATQTQTTSHSSSTQNTVSEVRMIEQPKEMKIVPQSASITTGSTFEFKAISRGTKVNDVSWSVIGNNSGSIDNQGIYTAPSVPGKFYIEARASGYYNARAWIVVKPPMDSPTGTSNTKNPTSNTLDTKSGKENTDEIKHRSSEQKPITNPPATPVTIPTKASAELQPTKKPETEEINTTKQTNPVRVNQNDVLSPTDTTKKTQDDVSTSSRRNEIEVNKTETIKKNEIHANVAETLNTAKNDLEEETDRLLHALDKEIEATARLKAESAELEKLRAIRVEIADDINKKIEESPVLSPKDMEEFSNKLRKQAGEANELINADEPGKKPEALSEIVDSITSTLKESSESIISLGGDLLYKDTNEDGISDYDSVHVYGVDPEKHFPVSEFDGIEISAEQKILLGYDPTQVELVEIVYEEPEVSSAPVVATYEVSNIELSPAKAVVIAGKALPNSFVTLYIYSTPIIVTIKTDANGEWEYELDKELENGEHTIYTATVNSSGKILAKSDRFNFIKTAEAAGLDTAIPASSEKGPSFIDGGNIYVLLAMFLGFVIVALNIIGRKEKQIP